MKIKILTLVAVCSIPLFSNGCGSSPDSRFYTLNSLPRDGAEPLAKTTHAGVTVKVGPITIPDTLDQSQIVTRSGPNALTLDEFNRWGGDLQDDIQRILGENISILLPTNYVILNQEISAMPIDYQVIVNIREFDGELGGKVTLNADWSVVKKGKGKTVVARKSVLTENTESAGYPSYVAAQSKLLGEISRQITREIRNQMALVQKENGS